MDSYQIAQQFKMLSVDEVDFIKRCVALLTPKPFIINIGANIGTSVCAMLEANSQAFIMSIDKRPCPEEAVSLIKCGLPTERVIRILGSSWHVGKYFPFMADMVFVDGAHDDEAVGADIAAWKPRCRKVMLFHDYNHPNIPTMNAIVDEAMADWERIGEARYLVGFKRNE